MGSVAAATRPLADPASLHLRHHPARRRRRGPRAAARDGSGRAGQRRTSAALSRRTSGRWGSRRWRWSAQPGGGAGRRLGQRGPILDELRRIADEGLVGRFLLDIFPWTSDAPLAALRAGHLDGLVDGFITHDNPLQLLRDVPGAAWKPYLQQRAAEVAPICERSGIATWAEFCFRFVRSTPQVVATVGSTSRQEHLDELVTQSQGEGTLPADVLDELAAR
ncbi:hypothetical protein [uncultured Friedmanniella sp.]|uniref:hypothetical protein n=1 Tax=uncultured Friedmanniella sp. TaxID=335381 RepID=UPI0035CBB3D5